MSSKEGVIVKQAEDAPVPEEILADAIVKLSQGYERAVKSGLTSKAISLLVKDMLPSPQSQQPTRYQIEMVLRYLPRLAATYVQKPSTGRKP